MEREDGPSALSLIILLLESPWGSRRGGRPGPCTALRQERKVSDTHCSRGHCEAPSVLMVSSSHFTEPFSFLTVVPLPQRQLAKAVTVSHEGAVVSYGAPPWSHGLCRAPSCVISPRPPTSVRPSEDRKETLSCEVACPESPSLEMVELGFESAISFLEGHFLPPGSQ